MERVGDYYTDFLEEEHDNRDEASDKKVIMSLKEQFKRLWVELNKTEIALAGCRNKGILVVKVHRSEFEVVAHSSEKHHCLMDLQLLRFHRFDPIQMNVDPAEGWFCAAIPQAIVNLVLIFFSFFY